jgi:hypothetical protein
MDRSHSMEEQNLVHLRMEHKRRQAIAKALKLDYLHPSWTIIRNERGWRDNEKKIEYYWSIYISRSFIGWLTVFTIKFDETTFRDIHNKSELLHGIISLKPDGEVDQLYYETFDGDTIDEFKEISTCDLFDANNTITLVESNIHLSNPDSKKWRAALDKVWELGASLASRSGNSEWIEFFKVSNG